ncbi:MAG: hypothetical protein JWQ83_891 [Lacunisphaera sp.]|nr:hypothetical protein [Lacunisphaera sp.]
MPHFFQRVLLVFLMGLASLAAAPVPAEPPWDTSIWNFESGMLWEIGSGTPFPYRIMPNQLSWRSKAAGTHEFANGARLLFRHRLTLIADLIATGPESHYVGISGSPSLELWDRTGTWSLFTGSGGGLGLTDARGVKGGLGQDFTFNWFIRGGIEHVTTRHAKLSAGIMYQHLSNGGQTKPNPGIDALGFTLGYGWSY